MNDGDVRVFVAIELSGDAKREFSRAIGAIDALGVAGVRTVRAEGIHLTLKFLGDVETAAIADIVAGLGRAANRSSGFSLWLGETGAFPNRSDARVIWVGIDGEVDRLKRLQSDVEEELRALGYRCDRRGFNPHITIARVRSRVAAEDVRRVVDAASSSGYAPAQIQVRSISLMRSVLHPDRAVYTSLRVERLGAPSLPPVDRTPGR